MDTAGGMLSPQRVARHTRTQMFHENASHTKNVQKKRNVWNTRLYKKAKSWVMRMKFEVCDPDLMK